MSSSGFEPLLRIEPRASNRARALLALLYALVAAGLLFGLPFPWALPALAVGALGLGVEWRRLEPPGLIEWRGDGEWRLDHGGPWRLHPATVLTPWLVVLVLDSGSRTVRVPVFPDSLPSADWRRLRARLRQQP